MARWLEGRKMPYFLPVFKRTTVSHRKSRTTEIPLFPGYVFVQGNHGKCAFARSGSVVRVLTPSCAADAAILDSQLCDVWRGLGSGSPLVPLRAFSAGELVEVLAGPMEGAVGRFMRKGRHGAIVLLVDMLGFGVSVELSSECRLRSLGGT